MVYKKNRVQIILLIIFVMLITSSCLFGDNNDTLALRDQVSALETQNALLQKENDTNDSSFNDVEAPLPPATEEISVVIEEPVEQSLPTEPVLAGQPIIYDGWSITVSKELIFDSGSSFGISILVRNLGDSDRVFRYNLAGVTIFDDQGKQYMPTSDSLCEEHMYITKNLSVRSEKTETIKTAYGFRNCHVEDGLQHFQGPIAIEANSLLIHFENFGPLSGVDFVIDL